MRVINKTGKKLITDCLGGGAMKEKAVKYVSKNLMHGQNWPIILMTSHRSNAEKIDLGGDKSSYPN